MHSDDLEVRIEHRCILLVTNCTVVTLITTHCLYISTYFARGRWFSFIFCPNVYKSALCGRHRTGFPRVPKDDWKISVPPKVFNFGHSGSRKWLQPLVLRTRIVKVIENSRTTLIVSVHVQETCCTWTLHLQCIFSLSKSFIDAENVTKLLDLEWFF